VKELGLKLTPVLFLSVAQLATFSSFLAFSGPLSLSIKLENLVRDLVLNVVSLDLPLFDEALSSPPPPQVSSFFVYEPS